VNMVSYGRPTRWYQARHPRMPSASRGPLSEVEDSLYQSATTRTVVVEPSFVIVAVRPMPAM
jgi:hypothetical protein